MDQTRNHFQRNTSWNAPYTFSGKEKDAETGYGYVKKLRFFSSLAFGNEKQVFHYAHCLRRFGARYYDSGLSIWLSVDPMSDKYPSMSPYNYCANNPVVLVDPDGREVIFNSLVDAIVVASQWMFSSQFKKDYKELKNSNEIYVFKGSSDYSNTNDGEFTTNGVVLIIGYNLKKDSKGNNCFTNLRHEMEHAVQFEYGEIGFDNGGAVNDFGNGVTTPNWNSSGVNADIFDEIKAFDKGYESSGYNAGKVETSDRHYWNSIEIEEKKSAITRPYPRHSTEVQNNSNTSRIQSDTQYKLPYRQRNP